jgi:hypothetical protein
VGDLVYDVLLNCLDFVDVDGEAKLIKVESGLLNEGDGREEIFEDIAGRDE